MKTTVLLPRPEQPARARARRSVVAALAASAFAFPPRAQAELYVRGHDLSHEAFAARIAARSDAVQLIEHWESIYPEQAQSRRLNAAFAKAQAAFLDGALEDAERAFRDVARMARDADWRESQRKAIAFAMMRLAQIAASPTEAEERLEAAVSFAPDLRPDEDAFPPPLVAAREKVEARNKIKIVLIDAFEKFPGYEAVKVDGRPHPVRPGALVPIPPGAHRISALSNAHPYFSQVLTAEQLKAIRIDQPPLTSGDCDSPRLIGFEALAVESVRAAFAECSPRFDRGGWTREAAPPPPPKLGLLPKAESGAGAAPAWAKIGAEPTPAAREASSSRVWLWAATAAAILAAGFVVYKAQEPAPAAGPVQPGSREGL